MSEGAPETEALRRRGRCHVLPDGVSLDDGIIPARFSAQRVMDPALLAPHLFETVDPALAARISPGDIIMAGRDFASGKPRLQGLIALEALGLSVICTSMPYRILRRAVARAIPVLTGAGDPAHLALDGDELSVDFAAGTLVNHTRAASTALPPLAPALAAIVSSGGTRAMLRRWLAAHPEQARR
ncbi:hypothetical protein H7F51_07160 [Novosphingobium flavum]|uniref:3-isopropylmalate dehydratase n=1 Tax=Novosphingobium flavum TaxID=1778672 RepID=A0A7X1KLG9_9SPHN|nr:hypothetical protein [Novosphingobium flavum]MBC2665293.1 hypothetical protein [Novosphingobium flavum]